MGRRSSLEWTLACHARDHEFKSRTTRQWACSSVWESASLAPRRSQVRTLSGPHKHGVSPCEVIIQRSLVNKIFGSLSLTSRVVHVTKYNKFINVY